MLGKFPAKQEMKASEGGGGSCGGFVPVLKQLYEQMAGDTPGDWPASITHETKRDILVQREAASDISAESCERANAPISQTPSRDPQVPPGLRREVTRNNSELLVQLTDSWLLRRP